VRGVGHRRRKLGLEIDEEWSGKKHSADEGKPDPARDEIWIDAEKDSGNDGHQLGLTPAVDDVPEAYCSRKHAE
jgi:hypothetical protein